MVAAPNNGPYRLRYEDLDTGSIITVGFESNSDRFDWVAHTKGIKTVEYVNPEPLVLQPPATTPDRDIEMWHHKWTNIADPQLPEWVDAVSAWFVNNEAALESEAGRRQTTIPELMVDALGYVFSIYADESDSDVAEAILDQERQKARHAQMTSVDKRHQCTRGMLEDIIPYGAPGVGFSARCRMCGLNWSLVGGELHDPAAGAHILDPSDTE